MSVFLKNKIELSKGEILSLDWHSNLYLIAVRIYTFNKFIEVFIVDAKVFFLIFNVQNLKFELLSTLKNVSASVISWHPCNPLLNIGWDSGFVSIHNVSNNSSFEVKHELDTPVLYIVWNFYGDQFLSANKQGSVNIWNQSGVEYKNRILNVNIGDEITCCIFINVKYVLQLK